MSGDLWRERVQIGRETTYGQPVAATRVAYLRDVELTREREPRVHRFSTGTRDNARAHTLGAVVAAGQAALQNSADELIEWLLCGIQGDVTPTTPSGFVSGRQWEFTPGNTVNSMTIERNDGARLRRASGVIVDEIAWEGSASGDNTVSLSLFSRELGALGAMTGSLSERTPTFIEGWETRLYIDAIGATPGTTLVAGTLVNWMVRVRNQLGRKWTADNTLALNRVTLGELDITANLTFEASASAAQTEYDNWNDETNRLVALEFGLNETIDAGTNELQTVTITGSPTGGTFTLTFKGQTTTAIAYNATAATVQAALEALLSIGAGNVSVGGGPGPGTPYTVTFIGQLSGLNVPQMTAAHSFTGGSSPNINVVTTTQGAGSKRAVWLYLPGAWRSVNLNGSDEGTRTYEFGLNYVYDPTNAYGFRVRVWNNRTAAF